jgi:hypothetical protein
MTPSIIEYCTESQHDGVNIVNLKASMKPATTLTATSASVDVPPVADDYMYDFKYNHPLPTADVLGVKIPKDSDAQYEADKLVQSLSAALHTANAEAFAGLFLEHGKVMCQSTFTLTLTANISPQAYGAISSRSRGINVHSIFNQQFSRSLRTCSRELKPAISHS